MADPIVEEFRDLTTAVVADVFRHAGYPQQVMSAAILPLQDGWKLCGRAFTHANLPRRKNEPGVFDEAEKALRPGDVIVESYLGAWGINYAVGAHARGCAGVVVDGPHRDLEAHRKILPDSPIFCRRGLEERSANPGGSHRSFRTRWLYAYNVPINCGGVRVEPGDIILGDDDGVVVIPKDIADDVLRFAQLLKKAEHECFEAKRAAKSDSEAHEPIDRWAKETRIQEWGRGRDR